MITHLLRYGQLIGYINMSEILLKSLNYTFAEKYEFGEYAGIFNNSYLLFVGDIEYKYSKMKSISKFLPTQNEINYLFKHKWELNIIPLQFHMSHEFVTVDNLYYLPNIYYLRRRLILPIVRIY